MPAPPQEVQRPTGQRCATPEPSDTQKEAIETMLRERPHTSALATQSINISVYVHVINRGAGLAHGDLPDSMINNQINVLNAAYANSPLSGGLLRLG